MIFFKSVKRENHWFISSLMLDLRSAYEKKAQNTKRVGGNSNSRLLRRFLTLGLSNGNLGNYSKNQS